MKITTELRPANPPPEKFVIIELGPQDIPRMRWALLRASECVFSGSDSAIARFITELDTALENA